MSLGDAVATKPTIPQGWTASLTDTVDSESTENILLHFYSTVG